MQESTEVTTEICAVTADEHKAITEQISAIEGRIAAKIRVKQEAFTRWVVDFLNEVERAKPLLMRLYNGDEKRFYEWAEEHTGYSPKYCKMLQKFKQKVEFIQPTPRISMGQVQILDLCPVEYLEPILSGQMTYKGLTYDKIRLISIKKDVPTLKAWVQELVEEKKLREAQQSRNEALVGNDLIVDRDDSNEGRSESQGERALRREELRNTSHRRSKQSEDDEDDDGAVEGSEGDSAGDSDDSVSDVGAESLPNQYSRLYISQLMGAFKAFEKHWNNCKGQLVGALADHELTSDDMEALRELAKVAGEAHTVLKQRL